VVDPASLLWLVASVEPLLFEAPPSPVAAVPPDVPGEPVDELAPSVVAAFEPGRAP
jgi:hypothetical protein